MSPTKTWRTDTHASTQTTQSKFNSRFVALSDFSGSNLDEPSQRPEVSAINTGNSFPLYYPLLESKNRELQKRMMEAQSGSHTVRSHGFTVARTHMHDWFILILLVVIDVILNIIHPFYRYVGKDMMSDLKFPLKSNTVPVWSVPIYSVVLPMVIFLIFYFRRRDVYDLHHGVLGLLFSVLITAVITDAIKDAVGRPRPDFFWRCFPDGKDIYDQWGNVICHGSRSTVREGHKSFPSGHTAWSFSGLGFLSLYLSGKVKAFDRGGHVAKLCIVFFPLLSASLVGISRVDDYWHHWQDVFAGGLIGLTIATFCYLQFFPPPYHSEGWGPYAYFRVLEESLVNGCVPDAANTCNTQLGVAQTEPQQNERNFRGVTSNGAATQLTVEDLEAGRS
ncbi:putative lipid phosphate phosphatase 3, chloroplastic [Heracleum sosnowskyi]|uniref:Lipid phosphate phosphatase 3, chloroplastic n=1 Tax=Heracleum sosnowskyi TaxID=360622 RepID=A0AAD8H5C4_9APIA|nr:putative lipid phosphate phosphatase 3, chloroplastic [Heracleum sosnowskyi]